MIPAFLDITRFDTIKFNSDQFINIYYGKI